MLRKLKFSDAPRRTMAGQLALVTAVGPISTSAFAASKPALKGADTATPIEHLVIIFQENVSFDHYFGTYPNALNPKGPA